MMSETEKRRSSQTSPAETQPEMFTLKSVSTLAGASTGLYVVLGTISAAFGWAYPRWFPLLGAFVLVFLLDFLSSPQWRRPAARAVVGRLLVVLLNSCLIFTSSMGGATALSPGEEGKPGPGEGPGMAPPPRRDPGPGDGPRADSPRHPEPGLHQVPSDPRRPDNLGAGGPMPPKNDHPVGRVSVQPQRRLKTGFSRFTEAFRVVPDAPEK
jgi:hypothetical protein